MLFKEIIVVYTENHTKPRNKNAELLLLNIAGSTPTKVSWK
jgi:hypothetical protein